MEQEKAKGIATRVVRIPAPMVERAEAAMASMADLEGTLKTIALMGLGAFLGWLISQALFPRPQELCPSCNTPLSPGIQKCHHCGLELRWKPFPRKILEG